MISLPCQERQVLQILADSRRELCGLTLVERSALPPYSPVKQSSVYVTLARLETKGLVSPLATSPVPGRKSLGLRRYYRVTAEGRRVLDAYLELQRALGVAGEE